MASMSEFQGFSDRELATVQLRGGGRGTQLPVVPASSSISGRGSIPPHKNAPGKKRSYSGHPTPPPPGATGLPQAAYFVQQSPPTPTKTDKTKLPADQSKPPTDQLGPEHPPSSATSTVPQELGEEENDTRTPNLHVYLEDQASAESNLEVLQKQQRELEDENKKRKALVEQTLQERYAKSQLEAKTLQAVKRELDRLDGLLNRDVTILRDRIEEANRQYTTAKKRYDAAEAEFVAAKLELHRTSESKELLSEHLCTIIQQNEVRKAEKLAELLKTLELENSVVDSSHSVTESLSRHTLFQKTPTPGINIWPHSRTSSEGSPAHRNTGVTSHKEIVDTKPHPTTENETSSSVEVHVSNKEEGEYVPPGHSESGGPTAKTLVSKNYVPPADDKTTCDPSSAVS